jgi:hypothetical protein
MSICPKALYTALLEDVRPHDRLITGPDAEKRDVAIYLLKAAFLKKFEEDQADEAEAAALSKFLAVNDQCSEWTLKTSFAWEDELVGLLKQEIYRFWNSPQKVADKVMSMPLVSSFGDVLEAGDVGPGASLGAEATDFYTKMFSSQLTTTRPFLLDVYRRHYNANPRWAAAEDLRMSAYGDRCVPGNKLGFVPKQRDIARTKATEPVVNMYYQLGFAAVLNRRLAQLYKIEQAEQPTRNRELARRGSIDGSLATIDLSSASDSISLKMVRAVFPADFVSWLEMFRSPMCRLPDGRDVELHMVSSMGNGYTFALETMLFACCVSAVYRQAGVLLRTHDVLYRPQGQSSWTEQRSNFAVWGDDIICDSSLANRVIRLLELLGFTVNVDKTFLDRNDPFRESCGYDYHRGEHVRAVYCKKLRSVASRFALINRLNRWSSEHEIPLSRTVGMLLDSVPLLAVPRRENDDAGVKVPLAFLREVKALRYDSNNSFLYKRFESRSLSVRVPQTRGLDDTFKYPPSVKRRKLWNPEGLHIAWIGGYIRAGRIDVKVEETPYRTRWAVSCSWDAPPDDLDRLCPSGWSRWASVTACNLR